MFMQRPDLSPYLPGSVPAFIEIDPEGFVPIGRLTPAQLEAAEAWALKIDHALTKSNVREARRYLEAWDPRFRRAC